MYVYVRTLYIYSEGVCHVNDGNNLLRLAAPGRKKKLKRLAAYLAAYRKIFSRNVKAQHFRTVYVDAFASTGSRIAQTNRSQTDALPLELADEEPQQYYKGSVRIALDVQPPFDEYLFIELNASRAAELETLKAEYSIHNITVVQGDANIHLKQWCLDTDWRDTRAVIFLDPFGMQVEWELLEVIAATHGIDLWLLFPLGMGVMRMLTKAGPPQQAWADRLTSVLGTDEWRQEFYVTQTVPTLFAEVEQEIRDADFASIQAFFVQRLKTIFVDVANNPLILRNSRNTPLYMLCFAASNPRGAVPAIKIAEYLLKE